MRRAAVDESKFSILEDNRMAQHQISWAQGSQVKAHFEIPSMHCASCIWLLDQLHKFDPGIISSDVDFLRKTVYVEFDATLTSLKSIALLLSSLGYEPLLNAERGDGSGVAPRRSAVRSLYMRIGVAGFAAGNIMMFSISQYLAGSGGLLPPLELLFNSLSILLSIPVLVYSASPWFTSAYSALSRRYINLDVPVALGISVLFVRSIVDITLGLGEGFLDSFAGLVLALLIGRLFHQKAFDAVSFDRTFRSFFPLSVRLESRGEQRIIPIDDVQTGDSILIRNGEIVPCDSVLISPAAYIDYSFVTGESTPVELLSGSVVHAGGKVVGKTARLTATAPASQSHLASLWERYGKHTERRSYTDLSDKFGARFTVIAVTIASIGFVAWLPDVGAALNVFTAVLIIACPCALTIATPVTLGTAMGALGRNKIFIKNTGTLLELSKSDTIVFDKTGTLTEPLNTITFTGRDLTEIEWSSIRGIASHSIHPVAQSIALGAPPAEVDSVYEEIGHGIEGRCNTHYVRLGTRQFVICDGEVDDSTHVSIDGEYVGSLTLHSRLRDGMHEMVDELQRVPSNRPLLTLVATGDSERDRPVLSALFGSHQMSFRLSPEDKVHSVEELQKLGRTVMMVGDGLNDAAAMGCANVSVAVTNDTSTLVPACDVVMPARLLHRLPAILRFAGRMITVIKVNLIFTIAYNMIGIALALVGLLTPVLTAIMMPVSSLVVVGLSVGGARLYSRRIQ
jgi:Cu+-exporting ATPase